MSQEPNVVEPCKGWDTPCTFCDKRFSEWKEPDEEFLSSDRLASPGLFMFALESKQGKETVVIGSHHSDIRSVIQQKLTVLRQQISHKKSKESKSNILLRFANFSAEDCKESCSVFAHWYNYGILPRLSTQWPGSEVLKNTSHYEYSELCQKWCHLTKDTFWRKPKTNLGPRAVKPCKGWKEACAFCEARFSTWMPFIDCKNAAPTKPGLVMFAFNHEGQREVILVQAHDSLRSGLFSGQNAVEETLRYGPRKEQNVKLDVRWMVVENLENEDSCFVYAHWINQKSKPYCSSQDGWWSKSMPGEEILSKKEEFEYRLRDKQWCFKGEHTRRLPVSYNKRKEKRHVQNSIKDDLLLDEET